MSVNLWILQFNQPLYVFRNIVQNERSAFYGAHITNNTMYELFNFCNNCVTIIYRKTSISSSPNSQSNSQSNLVDNCMGKETYNNKNNVK